MTKSPPNRTGRALNGAAETDQISVTGSAVRRGNTVLERQKKLRQILRQLLMGEVVPRVFEAHVPASDDALGVLSQDSLDEFRHRVVAGDHDACSAFVAEQRAAGMTLKELCLGLFTTTAQDLGELWSADTLSFAEVTIGLGTLHTLVHSLAPLDTSLQVPGARHNILLASAPSEQHAFGVLLLSKIFEMEGWLVMGGPDLHTGADLTSLVSKSWFDIIGLTASSEELALSLKSEIDDLRSASLNPDVFILVGGNGFAQNPSLAQHIGADDQASDAEGAIKKARAILLRRREKEG